MASVVEKIVETAKDMPEQQAAEVLNFAEFLKYRQAERPLEKIEQPAEADDWAEFEQLSWRGGRQGSSGMARSGRRTMPFPLT